MDPNRVRQMLVLGLALILSGVTGLQYAQARTPVDDTATASALLAADPGRPSVAGTVSGVTVTLDELRRRPAPPRNATPREANRRRTLGGPTQPNPAAGSGSTASQSTKSAQGESGRNLPQTPVDEIVGPNEMDTLGFVPPDTMGAVGPTQFLFSVNTHLQAFNKTSPHTKIFDVDEQAFWGTVGFAAQGVSDTHVRYDRASGRWFITEIDIPASSANNILLAVSSTSDLTTASWTRFAIPGTGNGAGQDQGCFADYDTPGIDQNAIYIGANMFGNVSPCNATSAYLHSNLYVIQKASALTNTLFFNGFFDVAPSSSSAPATIQGVDSVDALTTGYAVATDETNSTRQHLNVWQILNPGSINPTLSGPTTVLIPAENGSLGGVLSLNNVVSTDPTRPLDDLDDRLFAAVIRNGHLWTAHNVAVDVTGNANGAPPTRDAVRWYDVNATTLTLNQSGTVFDSAASAFQNYWMGTLMVSGQGHVAMGLNRANPTTDVVAGAVGRLAGDPNGTMGAFSLFQASTADPYDDGSFVTNPANRWGDYTYTSLDPCDDMTMWTTQEYVAGNANPPIVWGVAAEKLQAPPPATLTSSFPTTIPTGQTSVSVTINGTSTGGSGFYDTPATLTDPCRRRLLAAVSGGITVNSVSFTDPTHLQLNLSTVGTPAGPHTVTITNPDGQLVVGAVIDVITMAYLPFVRR
jgi:hypothetical protein